jgi:hypothetical protein
VRPRTMLASVWFCAFQCTHLHATRTLVQGRLGGPISSVAVGLAVAPYLSLAPSSCVISTAGMETLEKLPGIAKAAPGWLLATTTATAPAACACLALSANGQAPRSTTTILPLTASALSHMGSHPSAGIATTIEVLMLSAIFSAKLHCSLAYIAHMLRPLKTISTSGHGASSPVNIVG